MWEVKNKKMAELEVELKKGLSELRKTKERKFDQTVDLIVNLQKFDVKKNNLNLFVNVPHKVKDKKIAGFLEIKNKDVETITPDEFKKYSDKAKMKHLVSTYDFFIAQASLMPNVATNFGRVLGPTGKMPSPQLGIILNADEKTINELKNKINTSIKIKVKEPSIKIPIGKQSMKDEDIIENVMSVYNLLLKTLPRNKENIKNIEIKFTMTKPYKIYLR
ncbi:MAG: 50S ribosomal protein L1 [Candidatus Diapherotrites archaeon ADurb.Bin253]|nr:MAG: 50S ribosomal protein L1 [Candidatus Diapherotrites archaeon ADurb.Bin253]